MLRCFVFKLWAVLWLYQARRMVDFGNCSCIDNKTL